MINRALSRRAWNWIEFEIAIEMKERIWNERISGYHQGIIVANQNQPIDTNFGPFESSLAKFEPDQPTIQLTMTEKIRGVILDPPRRERDLYNIYIICWDVCNYNSAMQFWLEIAHLGKKYGCTLPDFSVYIHHCHPGCHSPKIKILPP